MKTFTYKGYDGTCETSIEDEVCFGKILFINDLILYQAEKVSDLRKAFEEAVDDYITTCQELGVEAKKPLKGLFNVRIHPELHKKAVLKAVNDETSLNDVVKMALENYLSGGCDINHHVSVSFAQPEPSKVLVSSAMEPTWLTLGTQTKQGDEHVH